MSRIHNADLVRAFAIIAVIAIHIRPFNVDALPDHPYYRLVELGINQLCRFAVPFFFVVSGYFWGKKVRRSGAPITTTNGMVRPLLVLFPLCCVLYLVPFEFVSRGELSMHGVVKVMVDNMSTALHSPLTLLTQGTSEHLWFLVALSLTAYIAALFLRAGWIKPLLAVAVAFYGIGLLGKAYADTPLGLHWGFNTRNGPFFSTLPFVSGYVLSGQNRRREWLFHGFLCFMAGALLHSLEIALLHMHYGTKVHQDFVIGTYFMGLGIAVMALSDRKQLQIPILSACGKMSLGIYLIHCVFIELLRATDQALDTPLWEEEKVFLIFGLSAGCVRLLMALRAAIDGALRQDRRVQP